jgi:hypothetical protein
MVIELVAASAGVVSAEDPLEAEIVGAMLASMAVPAGEAAEELLVNGLIPQIEARACAEAAAVLLAVSSVAEGRAAKAASVAAKRLVDAGFAPPAWAGTLAEPMSATDCSVSTDAAGTGSILACSFQRAGRSHGVLVSVDHTDCGAASRVHLVDSDMLPQALEMARTTTTSVITTGKLDPSEFRWQVERALDARAVHDADDEPELEVVGEEGPGYVPMAILLRSWLRDLPAPNKPPAAHGDAADRLGLTALLSQLAAGPFSAGAARGSRARGVSARLPAKRKRTDGPVPVYQIKVGLRGAKPPIWRRLEMPADISLARLHTVIQVAFGWDDSHLHVFETPYGRFGTADPELGSRAEAPVTLEQVAPAVGRKLSYTYDFGDDWVHDIVVEKVLDRGGRSAAVRCTGGRRAAPPEDCGGIWGYAELVEVLRDPGHPEHAERLEWMGLDDAADFEPSRFDADAVTRALAAVR